jgi:hypothetical protein
MTKTATVHAQQMWEYHSVTRKTEEFLVAELNELGKAGWELVGATFNKDIKGVAASFSWTAILKRPLVHAPVIAPPPEVEPSVTEPSRSDVTGGDAEIFDVRQ